MGRFRGRWAGRRVRVQVGYRPRSWRGREMRGRSEAQLWKTSWFRRKISWLKWFHNLKRSRRRAWGDGVRGEAPNGEEISKLA